LNSVSPKIVGSAVLEGSSPFLVGVSQFEDALKKTPASRRQTAREAVENFEEAGEKKRGGVPGTPP